MVLTAAGTVYSLERLKTVIPHYGPAGATQAEEKYTNKQINEAARKANIHGQHTLKELRLWLSNPHDQEVFAFLEQHELIRSPQAYDGIAATGDLFN